MAQSSELEEFWQGQEVRDLPQAGGLSFLGFVGQDSKPAAAQGLYFAFVLLKTYVLPLSVKCLFS